MQFTMGGNIVTWKGVLLLGCMVLMSVAVPNPEDHRYSAPEQLMYLVLQDSRFVQILKERFSEAHPDPTTMAQTIAALRTYSQDFLDKDRAYPEFERSLDVLAQFLLVRLPTCLELHTVSSQPTHVQTRDLYALATRLRDMYTVETICVALAGVVSSPSKPVESHMSRSVPSDSPSSVVPSHSHAMEEIVSPIGGEDVSLVNVSAAFRSLQEAGRILFPGLSPMVINQDLELLGNKLRAIGLSFLHILTANKDDGMGTIEDTNPQQDGEDLIRRIVLALRDRFPGIPTVLFHSKLKSIVDRCGILAQEWIAQLILDTQPARHVYPGGRMPEPLPGATPKRRMDFISSSSQHEKKDFELMNIAIAVSRIFPDVPDIVLTTSILHFQGPLLDIEYRILHLLETREENDSAELHSNAEEHPLHDDPSSETLKDVYHKIVIAFERVLPEMQGQPFKDKWMPLEDMICNLGRFVTDSLRNQVWKEELVVVRATDDLVSIPRKDRKDFRENRPGPRVPMQTSDGSHPHVKRDALPSAFRSAMTNPSTLLRNTKAVLQNLVPGFSKDTIQRTAHDALSAVRHMGEMVLDSIHRHGGEQYIHKGVASSDVTVVDAVTGEGEDKEGDVKTHHHHQGDAMDTTMSDVTVVDAVTGEGDDKEGDVKTHHHHQGDAMDTTMPDVNIDVTPTTNEGSDVEKEVVEETHRPIGDEIDKSMSAVTVVDEVSKEIVDSENQSAAVETIGSFPQTAAIADTEAALNAQMNSGVLLNAPKMQATSFSDLTSLNVFLMVCLSVALLALVILSVLILRGRGEADANVELYREMRSEC